jgi:multicomponent Na+:H+ antiporter subunit D
MPITFTCFTILSLSLIGIPPTGGFYSKWYIATAALDAQLGALSWIAPIILLISAILTAAYLLSISISAFFGKSEESTDVKVREPLLMVIPIIVLTVIAVAGGIFSVATNGMLTSIL